MLTDYLGTGRFNSLKTPSTAETTTLSQMSNGWKWIIWKSDITFVVPRGGNHLWYRAFPVVLLSYGYMIHGLQRITSLERDSDFSFDAKWRKSISTFAKDLERSVFVPSAFACRLRFITVSVILFLLTAMWWITFTFCPPTHIHFPLGDKLYQLLSFSFNAVSFSEFIVCFPK